jgi:hypothetical protein
MHWVSVRLGRASALFNSPARIGTARPNAAVTENQKDLRIIIPSFLVLSMAPARS